MAAGAAVVREILRPAVTIARQFLLTSAPSLTEGLKFQGAPPRHVIRFLPLATMLRLNPEQRRLVADKALDAANLAAGALVFGQALSEREFSVLMAVVGFGACLAFIALGLWLTKEIAG
jgi:hypothetical protein